MIVTPRIGLQFRQDGEIMPIYLDRSILNTTQSYLKMRRAPFQILVSERKWKSQYDDSVTLLITISDNPRIFALANQDNRPDDLPFFHPALAVASDSHGTGELFVTDLSDEAHLPYNIIYGFKFDVEETQKRGVYISAISDHEGTNLLQTANAIYMVFHMNEMEEDPTNFDLVRIELAD